jgi:hypothetical protein
LTVTTAKTTCGRFNETREGESLKQVACKVGASWMVGVVFTDKHKIEETTIWVPTMLVCNRHRVTLEIKDAVSDASWGRMVTSLTAQGHRAPKRSLTRLAFKSTKNF